MKFTIATKVLSLFACFSAATFAKATAADGSKENVTRRKIEKETGGTTFACTVRLLASKAKPGVFIPSVVKCVSNDARSIRLDGDLVKFFGDSSFIRNTEISFPESLIVDGAVDLDAADPLTISISRGSGIISSPFTGTYKVLVVRVTDGVNAPTNTVAELGTKTFDDDVNLRKQFLACSGDQLSLIPATGAGVANGAIEMLLWSSTTIANTDAEDIALAADRQLWWENFIFFIDFDLVMFVISSAANHGGALGAAYLNGDISWYDDTNFAPTYVSFHEIGHNLGLDHSGYQGNEYGDATCVMGGAGYFDDDDEKGSLCFNAAKSHYLGWFNQYHSDFTPATTGYSGELVPTNDVVAGTISTGEHYILKLSGTSETDLYVFYNKSEGVTATMDEEFRTELGNAVVVYSQATVWGTSTIVGALSTTGAQYTQSNWAWSGGTLTIEVCSITAGSPDKAKVIVYVDGVTTASCTTTTSAPTGAPVVAPTSAPTSAPVVAPTSVTGAPVVSTTPAPTSAPVVTTPTTSAKCQDTDQRFEYGFSGDTKTCNFIAKYTERCGVTNASSKCPVTCNTGCECYDTVGRFEVKLGKKTRKCAWAARKNTEERCARVRVRANCPVTCGVC